MRAVLFGWWRRTWFGGRLTLGGDGERLAARYLKRQGYRIISRNVRNHIGEIDLIARDGGTLVFVEVKTRAGLRAGHPSEAVTPAKQRQLTRAALAWLKSRGLLEHRARFDVVAVTTSPDGPPVIEHYVHAFEAFGEGQLYS